MPCCANVPQTVDKDLDDRGIYLENLAKATKHFEKSVTETITAYQQQMITYEKVSSAFVEMSQSNENDVQNSCKKFEEDMRKLKDGPAMAALQTDMTRVVREGLASVTAERDKVYKMYKSLKEIQKSHDNYRYQMSETEKKYAKKNKAIGESKSYAKTGKKRDDAWAKYNTKKTEFDDAVEQLRVNVKNFINNALSGYGACTAEFAKHLGKEMEAAAGTKGTANETKYSSGTNTFNNNNNNNNNNNPTGGVKPVFDPVVKPQYPAKNNSTTNNPLTLEQEYYDS